MTELSALDNSPLRYPGSKSRRAIQLLRFADQSRKHYVEPFAGGLGMLFRARKERLFRTYSANDIDERVVNGWLMVRDRCDELISRLRPVCDLVPTKDFFLKFKDDLRTGDELTRAAAFLVLNKWTKRGNGGGFDETGDITLRLMSRLSSFSELLQDVVITNKDYQDLCIDNDSFVFFDPPYERVGRTLYRNVVDLIEFRDWTLDLNCSWLTTLNDSPFTNNLFGMYDRVVEPISARLAPNAYCNPSNVDDVSEIVIMNYQRPTLDAFLRQFGWSVRKAKSRDG